MGVFDKIRTMFTEEIEEEVPIKKEVIQVEIPSPVSESVKDETNRKEDVKKEEKFTFPVFFDDSDFEAIENANEKKNNNNKNTQAYSKNKTQEKPQEKRFTPTPIISPVYGILDKNYHKEDITPKKTVVENIKKEDVTIDDVRKKAFGTLEDILENTLFGKIVFDDIENETKKEDKDLFYELEQMENKISDKQVKEEKKTNSDSYNLEEDILTRSRNIKNINKNNINSDIKTRVERNKHLEEQLQYDFENDTNNNSDLFNLIDSMYERGDK